MRLRTLGGQRASNLQDYFYIYSSPVLTTENQPKLTAAVLHTHEFNYKPV